MCIEEEDFDLSDFRPLALMQCQEEEEKNVLRQIEFRSRSSVMRKREALERNMTLIRLMMNERSYFTRLELEKEGREVAQRETSSTFATNKAKVEPGIV